MFCRGYSHCAPWLLGICLASCSAGAWAGDYVFHLPLLERTYLGDDSLALPSYSVTADFGFEFAEIRQASILIEGTLTTGLYGELDSPELYPLTAGMLAWFDGVGPSSGARLEKYLPAVDGTFQLQDTFRMGALEADFAPWLDGLAEFQFAVLPPLMQGVTFTDTMPTVTITSAALWIEGQPNLDSFMVRPDFDLDGNVDEVDLARWQAAYHLDPTADADGDGDSDGLDFLAWQRSFGRNLNLVGVAVPEPSILLLSIIAFTGLAATRGLHRT